MALQRAKRSDIPEDAVILTEREAVEHQRRIFDEWSKPSDVFAYKFGAPFLGIVSGAIGGYLNSFYRRKFKLRSQGLMSSYLPCVIIPSITSFIMHYEGVLPEVILQKNCPVCIELRAASVQALTGCFIPTALSTLTGFVLATQYITVRLPDITREPLKVFQFWKTTTKPIGNILFAIMVGQAFLGSMVTYLEAKSVHKCLTTLDYIEEQKQRMLEM